MKLVKKLPLRPSELVLIGDQLLVVFGLATALFASYRLLAIKEFPLHTIFYRILIHVTLGILAWSIFKIYQKVIRFFNSKDYLNLLGIVLLIHVASASVGLLLPAKLVLKPEVFVISFFITSLYIIVSRFFISYLYVYYRKSKKIANQKHLLIYGAGELGVFLKKSIRTHYEDEFKLCGFLDDDRQKIGRSIGGIPVIDAEKGLKSSIERFGITDIIIANKTITPARKALFLEQTLMFNVRIREISSINSMLSNFNMDKLSMLDINDLMNREAIQLYGEHVATRLKEKAAMVTGAAGSIGSEIVRKLAEHNVSMIICVDFSESALYDLQQELLRKYPALHFRFILADIRDEEIMKVIFKKYTPDIIYHAAAYKHVPLMEQYPWQAIHTNVIGTWHIAKLAIQHKAEKFVFISSDKAVNPTSVMGATKRLAEIIVQSLSSKDTATSFAVTRFGNVLGSNGSVVPLFKKQIQSGGPVTVTHPEMIRYFMTIAEACQLVLEASVMAEGGEVFVFDMGKPVKIVDLAKNMIRLAGFIPDVDMPIQFIGQRPGEKLYEDLFSDKEKLKETYHDKIMISNESNHEILSAEYILAKLQNLEHVFEPAIFREIIQELIPEYQPETSDSREVVKIKSVIKTANTVSMSNIASVN